MEVKNTKVYTHALNMVVKGPRCPLDQLRKAVSNESGGIRRSDRSS